MGIYRNSQEALKHWLAFNAAMTERLENDAPPSARVTAVLEKLGKVASRYVSVASENGNRSDMPETAEESRAPAEDVPAAREMPRSVEPTREDMLQQLVHVAQYFEKHEPQSPLAKTLYEAVRRARLSWTDLLAELVDDAAARTAILSRLGITAGTSSSKDD